MADYIVKIPHKGIDYYLLWSTNTDSPVTHGASLAAFKKYYKDQYGEKGTLDLCERLERVEKKGVSSHIHNNVEELIECNRAGDDEEELTMEQIIKKYCRVENYC